MTMHSRPSSRRQGPADAFINQASAPETTQLHCIVPRDLHRRLRVLAAQEETSVTSLVLEALNNLLENRN